MRLLIPSIGTGYVKKAIPIINLLFVGTYGTQAMIIGVSMGNGISKIFGNSIFKGINMAVETFVS